MLFFARRPSIQTRPLGSLLSGLLTLLSLCGPNAAFPSASAPALKKILLLAGPKSHPPGEHEFEAGSLLLQEALNQPGTGIWAQVNKGWPADPHAFDSVSAVAVYCDGEGGHVLQGHFAAMDSLNRLGVGVAMIHYAVQVDSGAQGNYFLDWLGGYFESYYSVNPTWTPDFDSLPKHPAAIGLIPYTANDEWYFHIRFRASRTGITPLLVGHPPLSLVEGMGEGPYGRNPEVLADVKAGQPQWVSWVTDNGSRGRGFGFTGAHYHRNWGLEYHQRTVLNGLAWIAHASIPAGGMPVLKLTPEQVTAYIGKPIPPLTQQSRPVTSTVKRPGKSGESGRALSVDPRASELEAVRDAKGRDLGQGSKPPVPTFKSR